jgi:CheY-like chemotaxis protein
MAIRLLVVDDDPFVLEPLTEYLLLVGFQVCSATSGAEALQVAEHFLPDLVLSDFKMPGMNGYTLCSELHRRYGVPAVIMSGYCDDYEEKRWAVVGICDFIQKPIPLERLEQRLKAVLAQFRGSPLYVAHPQVCARRASMVLAA